MILIVAPPDDFHAYVAQNMLRRTFGETCEILDLATFPAQTSLTLCIDSISHHAYHGNSSCKVAWSEIQCVWWRRPRPPTFDGEDFPDAEFTYRESASLALALLASIRVVNRPIRQQLADYKGFQLLSAREAGLQIPRTIITNHPDEVRAFQAAHADCVFKVLTSKDQRLIPTQPLDTRDFVHLNRLRLAPIIVQERLPLGKDIRVNVFGNEVFAAEKAVDSIDGRLDFGFWSPHVLPTRIESGLLALLERLGIEYGCVDLRLAPDQQYFFLEVNPAGQFLMVERDTGQPLTESFCRLLLAR